MNFDGHGIFANLAELERLKGHHSAEGRAIRTLSRALSGWLAKNLSERDVVVLCDQAVEDWLKARLKVSAWSAKGLTELLAKGVETNLITRLEAVRLQRLDHRRHRSGSDSIGAADAEAALECCIQIIQKRW
jgi:ATP-dependent Clp protease ATP-binding subunit ClpA